MRITSMMPMTSPFIEHYYTLLMQCMMVLSVLIILLGIDDVLLDLWFWMHKGYRYLVQRHTPDCPDNTIQMISHAALLALPEKPLAIMVPAWQEEDVIAHMLQSMVETLHYRNYVIFVGTYPNDAATIAEVMRVQQRYRHIIRVEVPHAGPTCKADCLNRIIRAIQLHEQQHAMLFSAVILHDSEDVLHPMELHFFNHCLPAYDMVQLPVMPLQRRWHDVVNGTYMDDFAQWHAKDLPIRQQLSGTMPSAGVGTCFSRRAIQTLAHACGHQPFNTDSLTEDYDIGLRLGSMGMASLFALYDVTYSNVQHNGHMQGQLQPRTAPLSVREYFPATLRAAYRQKARWAIGIGLQSWLYTGWSTTFMRNYFLYRDRKGMFTPFVSAMGYVLLLQFAVLSILAAADPVTIPPPPLLPDGTLFKVTTGMIAIIALLRIVQRIYFVTNRYGYTAGLLSVPRMVVGDIINICAVTRAWWIFYRHRVHGHPITWDKTQHEFPYTGAPCSSCQEEIDTTNM